MLTVALMVIALLAKHCEAEDCYTCEEGTGGYNRYENCDKGPPTLSSAAPAGSKISRSCAAQQPCMKLTLKNAGRKYITRGCFVSPDCTAGAGHTSGCKSYKYKEYSELQACGLKRSGYLLEEKGSASNSELRQGTTEIYHICLCSGNLCIAGEAGGGGGAIKMTEAGMIIIMINIAIAATSGI